MHLSDAIRLGALLLPRSDGYLDEEWDGAMHSRPTGCCALGGAALAAGFNRARDKDVVQFIHRHWGAILRRNVHHPVSGIHGDTVHDIINGLNDSRCAHWSREQIADFVESVEKKEATDDATKPHEAVEHSVGA